MVLSTFLVNYISFQNLVYDDFISQLGGKFDASAIVGLIADSGAQYMVPVTMHHDGKLLPAASCGFFVLHRVQFLLRLSPLGFALFDTAQSTHRSSVYLGPKRDFLGELFAAAKAEQPHLHRGTYVISHPFLMNQVLNPRCIWKLFLFA